MFRSSTSSRQDLPVLYSNGMGVRFHVGPISFGLGRPKPFSAQEERDNFILGSFFVAALLALGFLPVLGLVAAVAFSGWLKDKGIKNPHLISAASYVLTTACWFLAFFFWARDAGFEAAARIRPETFSKSELTQEMAMAEYIADAPGQIFGLAVLSGLTMVILVGIVAGLLWIFRQLGDLAKRAWGAI